MEKDTSDGWPLQMKECGTVYDEIGVEINY